MACTAAYGAGSIGVRSLFFGQSFRSFPAFKRAFGLAGKGKHWHHIVEQHKGNVSRFGARRIHNTINLRLIDAATHYKINGFYSSTQPAVTGSQSLTVRQWLRTQPYKAQHQFGTNVLRQLGGG